MSVWQTPQATRRTSTSPALGSARSISCTTSGFPNSSSTAARIRMCLPPRGQCLTAGTLARAQRHAQARRAHREAEALARLGAGGLPLEVAGEHRQRGLALQEGEVAARAEARAGAEGEEGLGVGAVGEPAVRVEALAAAAGARSGASGRRSACRAGSSTPPAVRVGVAARRTAAAPSTSAAPPRGTTASREVHPVDVLGVSRGSGRSPSAASASAARRCCAAGSRASRYTAHESVLAVVSSPASSIVKTLPNTSWSS